MTDNQAVVYIVVGFLFIVACLLILLLLIFATMIKNARR